MEAAVDKQRLKRQVRKLGRVQGTAAPERQGCGAVGVASIPVGGT